MRKLAAILLLLLFIFNLAGYKVWFYYLQNSTRQQLQASIDKQQYDDKDLLTIKVPLSLPYFTNWSEFEQYNGSIEVNGQHYNYVKRKVYNDTLILLCIPNEMQNRLSAAKNDFEKLVNTVQTPAPGNKTGHTALVLKALLGEFNQAPVYYQPPVLTAMLNIHILLNDPNVYNHFATSPWQPPETI